MSLISLCSLFNVLVIHLLMYVLHSTINDFPANSGGDNMLMIFIAIVNYTKARSTADLVAQACTCTAKY